MNNLDHQESDSESGDMSVPPVQSVEDFWGLELSSKKKKLEWETDDNDDEIDIDKTLELRQACLGASAKEGERNVVQITTENDEGEEVTHTILSMKVGLIEQSALFLTLRPPVVFELVSGSGPVHIVGNVTESLGPLIDSESESSDEDEGEISSPEVKALQAAASKKRPADSPAKKPAAKVAKIEDKDKEEDEDEMEASEDEEEDESEEEESEDEDEESEDEEDEEETKPPPKKQQANGKLKGKPTKAGDKATTFKTPQVAGNKKAPVQQRGTQSAPTTPKVKGDKKKGGPQPGKSTTAPGVLTTDQMKQRLLKMSPHIPKKLEKFNNYVSNNFKVKDEATKKHLWEFVQKNRAGK